jgi:cytidylate kinase
MLTGLLDAIFSRDESDLARTTTNSPLTMAADRVTLARSSWGVAGG